MICGTTPTHTFEVPLTKDEIVEAWVMYGQGGTNILTKKTDSLKIEDNKIMCTLTQEESASFTPRRLVEVQLKFKLKSGEVVASEIVNVTACAMLDCGTI